MVRINYKSDFTIHSSIGEKYKNQPFRFVYYVPNGMNSYEVSFDGTECKNCSFLDDGSILSIMNIHNGDTISPIGIGRLKVERYFYLDNESYIDGIENLCTNEYTDIVLVDGASDELEEITDTIYFPLSDYYTKQDVDDKLDGKQKTLWYYSEYIDRVAQIVIENNNWIGGLQLMPNDANYFWNGRGNQYSQLMIAPENATLYSIGDINLNTTNGRAYYNGNEIATLNNVPTPEDVLNLVAPIILEIDLGTNPNAFANVADFQKVHTAMLNGEPINFCIRANYASGTKFVFYPTCVKANYISLNAKAGSCELHVSDDGTFTLSGTKLW